MPSFITFSVQYVSCPPINYSPKSMKIISLDSKWCLVQTIRGECFCWCLHKTWTWTVPCFPLRKSLSSPLRSRCPCAQCPGGGENKERGCALCNGDSVCSLLTHFQFNLMLYPAKKMHLSSKSSRILAFRFLNLWTSSPTPIRSNVLHLLWVSSYKLLSADSKGYWIAGWASCGYMDGGPGPDHSYE